MARSGMEIMIGSVIKALGLDPQIVLQKVEEIRQSMYTTALHADEIRANQLEIIRQNRAIMAKLEIEDGRTVSFNGSGACRDGQAEG